MSAATLRAQQSLPAPDQAKRMLETRPDLVAQVRREIAASGLTPDQVRSRLRAAGYPDDLLDAYIGPRRPGLDSASANASSADVLDAIAALGITDSADTSELRQMLRSRSRRGARDSVQASRSRDGLADSLSLADLPDDSLDTPVDGPSRARTLSAARRRRAAADSGFAIFGGKGAE